MMLVIFCIVAAAATIAEYLAPASAGECGVDDPDYPEDDIVKQFAHVFRPCGRAARTGDRR